MNPFRSIVSFFFHNCPFTESVNEIPEINFNIVWEEMSDDQLEEYGNILDKFSVSCNTVSCDNALHHQLMDYLYSAMVKSVKLASNYLAKTFQHWEKHITGWNHYCKNLHQIKIKIFIEEFMYIYKLI